MKSELIDIFPLTILKSKILLSKPEKMKIIDFILSHEKKNPNTDKISKDDGWLGDSQGQEFLFKEKIMLNLSKLIGDKIKEYVQALEIDSDKIHFYYQRTWATITRKSERIKPHAHVQSNISFAYYLIKPNNSGNLRFITESQNEIATGLFTHENVKLGLLKNNTMRNTPNVDIEVKEDDIVVFPSKNRHCTIPNDTNKPRISISGDVSIMLSESFGHEKLMPHFSQWQSF